MGSEIVLWYSRQGSAPLKKRYPSSDPSILTIGQTLQDQKYSANLGNCLIQYAFQSIPRTSVHDYTTWRRLRPVVCVTRASSCGSFLDMDVRRSMRFQSTFLLLAPTLRRASR